LQRNEGFATFGLSTQVKQAGGTWDQALRYGLRLTRYYESTGADNTSHDAGYVLQVTPTAKASVNIAAAGSLSDTSAVTIPNPQTGSTTGTAVGAMRLLNVGLVEGLRSLRPAVEAVTGMADRSMLPGGEYCRA